MANPNLTLRAIAAVRERLRSRQTPSPAEAQPPPKSAPEYTSATVQRPTVEELLAANADLAVELDRRRAIEDELRAKEQRLEAILENTAALIYIKDLTLRYTQVSKSFNRLGGGDLRAACVGRTDFEVFDPDTAHALRSNDEWVISNGTPRQVHERLTVDGQLRHFLSVKFPLFDASGELEGLCGISTDITEMYEADDERRRIESQIQHTQKLESLGVLAGGIAHDFNNLLTGILGNVTLTLFELSTTHPARALVEQIEIAALRASELTQQMLAYAGKGKLVIEPLDLSELVHGMQSLLRASVSKKVVFDLDVDPSPMAMEGDESQLHQVIMNLVSNAAESIGDREGKVTVRTFAHEHPSDDDGAHWTAPLPAGRYIALEVIDDGAGIEPEKRARIFEPFYTTKFPGRGLGLAALLGIVHRHGGAIRVVSRPGEGSAFLALFPESVTALRARSTTKQRRAEPLCGEGTILLVEDEELSRVATATMLRRCGFTVIEACDGYAGVAAFRDHLDEIRIVLLDLNMPRLGGEEVLAAVKALHRDVPVILMSGYRRDDHHERLTAAGAATVLQKPFGVDDLLNELAALLESPCVSARS